MVSEVEKETAAEYINKGRPVYFSYARNSNKNPEWTHISDCVDVLLKEFDKNNIEYRVDRRDIGAGDKISDFEREIGGQSEVVVIVFSDKYFRSLHCMYEFVQIKKSLAENPSKRLLCIKSGDFNLADIRYILELERFWGDQRQSYEEIEYHRLRAHSGTEIAAFENGFYMDDVRNLYSFFSAINYSYATNEDWSGFIKDIQKYYTKPAVPPPPKPKPEPQPQQAAPQSLPKPEPQQAMPQSQPVKETVNKAVSQSQPQQFKTTPVQPAKTSLKKKILYGVIGVVAFFIIIGQLVDGGSSTATKSVSASDAPLKTFQDPVQIKGNWSAELYVYMVEIYEEYTVLYCTYESHSKGDNLSVKEDTYIYAGGQRLNLVSTDLKGAVSVKKGETISFYLVFPAIPDYVDEIDLSMYGGVVVGGIELY